MAETEEIKETKKGKKVKEEKEEKSAYEKVLEGLEKDFGKGIVQNTETPRYEKVASTGSFKLDRATNIGGIPITGCIVELMGWESSGKSTLCQQIVGEVQKATGKRALYIDGEHSLDMDYATVLGMDCSKKKLLIAQPESGEDAYNIAERLMDTGEVSVVIIDSQTALLPKAVISAPLGASNIGVHARLMSQAVPKLLRAARRNQCMVIFISQFREKIGVMFGSPETTNGGNALKFYAHMRLVIRRSVEKDEGRESNQKVNIKVIKNKFAAPFGKAEDVYINFGEGVDKVREIFDLAVEFDFIQQGGAWFTYKDMKVQGEEGILDLLRDNEGVYEELKAQVLEKLQKEYDHNI